jgi:hypothetical protein
MLKMKEQIAGVQKKAEKVCWPKKIKNQKQKKVTLIEFAASRADKKI